MTMTREKNAEIIDLYIDQARKHPCGSGMFHRLDNRSQAVQCALDAEGLPTIAHEYYRDEGMEDDDLSMGGYMLRHNPGYVRVRCEWTPDQFATIPEATIDLLARCLPKSPADAKAAERAKRITELKASLDRMSVGPDDERDREEHNERRGSLTRELAAMEAE